METTTVVRAVIANEANEIVVGQRADDDEWRPGACELPGGAVEPGETEREACCREVAEETGIQLRPEDLRPIMEPDVSVTAFAAGNVLVTRLFFLARVEGSVTLVPGKEQKGLCWTSVPDALELIQRTRQRSALQYMLEHNLLGQAA